METNDLMALCKPAEQPATPKTPPLDKSFWMKRGYLQPYTLGKALAGTYCDGTPQEFLTKILMLFKSHLKCVAAENGAKIDDHIFELINIAMSMGWKQTNTENMPTIDDIAKFLATLTGFFDAYIANTHISEKI